MKVVERWGELCIPAAIFEVTATSSHVEFQVDAVVRYNSYSY